MPIFYPQHYRRLLTHLALLWQLSLQTTPFLFQNFTIKYYECMTLPWPFEPSTVTLNNFHFLPTSVGRSSQHDLLMVDLPHYCLPFFCFSVNVFRKYLIHMAGFNRLISNLLRCIKFPFKMFMTLIASSVSKILQRQTPFHHLLFTIEWEF